MLKYKKFILNIRLLDATILPKYKGITLRGGFGNVFKSIACVQKAVDCSDCILNESCIYRRIFDSPKPKDSMKMKKYPYIPHPFVIFSENFETYFSAGDIFDFGLVLFGESIEYLPFFIYTFIKLGEIGFGKNRAKFEVISVRDGDKELFDQRKKTISSFLKEPSFLEIDKIISKDEKSFGKLKISFLSPVSLRFEGKTVYNPEFHILARNILRRISLLEFFYGEPSFDAGFIRSCISEALIVKTVESNIYPEIIKRFSGRQKRLISHIGLVGDVSFVEVPNKLIRLIDNVKEISIGRNTSFGFGRYITEF
ncbi:CRISPR-associated protein Cas6 [Thermodesulfobium narugense DSM 14796]|uniref:CRISPR-associated protein Cas6 n=1 Tax=Thermodesulfobium narugense DSM 14796 TaxID=747365 RepID=M1E8T8_9BACT|nr:CRISPR system precrRNA processing endoribonuclease RAMP protein Cas6 [Thermodesulfobium narugense]AEE15343.1 CRISPR-associated protein Cas6 [Thermodesulfobium narugense DSM 14796]